MISSEVDFDAFVERVEDKPCEWMKPECDSSAAYMVWSLHNWVACPHTQFMCEVHLNKFVLQAKRIVDSGGSARNPLGLCKRCGFTNAPETLSEFVRWIPL